MKLSSGTLVLVMAGCVTPAARAGQPEELDRAIHDAIAGFPGKVCLAAKNLDSGKTYGLLPDQRVRTASTIKLPIMTAVFEEVERSRARWSEELTLTSSAKASGSGVLRELSDGVRLPLRDLVRLMIVVSDNTATNLVLDRVPPDTVNAEMDRLGLPQTRCLRKIAGEQRDPAAFGASKAALLPENAGFGIGVSTPHEMVELLEKLEQGKVVSPGASKEMIEILKRQQYKDGIGRHLGNMAVASKSGALDHLRSDVGIVYSPKGRIAIAITCEDLPNVDYSPDNPGLLLISKLARTLIDKLAQ